MRRQWLLLALAGAIPAGFGVVLLLVAPVGTALQFGADEGYELMKALLVSRGHALYGPFWNDQPPLHTELVALVFRVFGPSALAGRLVSVGFAMVLMAALYGLVSQRSGRAAGVVAVGLLVAAPGFLEWSVSVMLEMPAVAMGLAAVWAWSKYDRGAGRRWLVASGVLFGCALQVKLTAMIFGPALAVAWVVRQLSSGRRQGPETGRRGLAAVSEWLVLAGAVVVAFGLIGLVFYRQDTVGVFWRSHFSAGTRAAAVADSYGFRLGAIVNEFGLLVPAAVGGIGLIGWQRRWDLLLPVALLGTVLVVHWFERPYWPYYGLHFAVPLAWLGAVGIVEGFGLLWRQEFPTTLGRKLWLGLGVLGWSLVVSWALTLWPDAIWDEVEALRAEPPAAVDATVAALRRNAAGTRWVFTDRLMCAFWAGLSVPPELAIIPSKRIWSGQISGAEVRQCLERYRPELILLEADQVKDFGLTDYLQAHYRPASETTISGLYVRK